MIVMDAAAIQIRKPLFAIAMGRASRVQTMPSAWSVLLARLELNVCKMDVVPSVTRWTMPAVMTPIGPSVTVTTNVGTALTILNVAAV